MTPAPSKLSFSLDVDPMPAPRPRARAIQPKGGRRAIATIYNPSNYTAWATATAGEIRDAIAEDLDGPLEGPLTVGIIITAERPKTSKLTAPRWDIDNGAKAVMDAMTKAGVWHDDSQVEFLAVKKQWGAFGQIDVEVSQGVAG